MVLAPLIRIVEPTPGSPVTLRICTPAAFPLREFKSVGSPDLTTASVLTTEDDEPC